MNKAGILVVGNEILDGITLDTNTQWLINKLKPMNYTISETITVRDDTTEIAKAINRMMDDDIGLIITTGGLGPTYDDLTLKGVAEAFGLPMTINPVALSIVTRQYKAFHESGVVDSPEITDARRKMAVFPVGAKPLDNKAGGAPGVMLRWEGAIIVSLPGVPSELKWIFDNPLKPILADRVEGCYTEKIINLSARDESMLAPLIDEANKLEPDVYIKSMVKSMVNNDKGYVIRLWISCHGEEMEEIQVKVDKVSDFLVDLAEKTLT
ncbi:competence/damage-inducible protein A [Candidatus Bathyarchaeota archaeon]|jgi:nicotinamide-nucleotide amidase|nr:competence/damage-inducible protein A [Candidatus Bathyarchaeota archaeon]MBT4319345.1 competence/damage-inducible protein A [Candidatus Bathyarchaeota archaeon]MBT4424876.1 competence/damage-inducible protein A [Candidatus Bathyarchaeota archaeon]MBT5643059.1 competence/damage-inducible protein A [Candidatus Bathyarchaeota archaeon]MBT7186598.1 competence/damage-inducible protein A [Candidatus Bathyarchaeota archaeon]